MTDRDPPRAAVSAGRVATVTFLGSALRRRQRLRLRWGSATDLVGGLALATKEHLLQLVEVVLPKGGDHLAQRLDASIILRADPGGSHSSQEPFQLL